MISKRQIWILQTIQISNGLGFNAQSKKREIPSHRVMLTQTLATGAIERVFPVETGVSETIRLEIRFLKEQPQTGYSRNKKPTLKILSDAG